MTKTEPSERAIKIADFICAYVHSGLELNGVLRTLLDTLAAELCDESESELYRNNNGVANWFNWGNLRDATRRDVLKTFPHTSPAAAQLVKDWGTNHIPKDPKLLVCDHVVPIKEFQRQFQSLSLAGQLDADSVLKTFYALYRRCIITRAEDKKLAKDRMPPGWNIDCDPWARYKVHQTDDWRWAQDKT